MAFAGRLLGGIRGSVGGRLPTSNALSGALSSLLVLVVAFSIFAKWWAIEDLNL